jgi:hypothetical protein
MKMSIVVTLLLAAVLSHVRTARIAENSVRKILASVMSVNNCLVEGDKHNED